MDKAFRVLSDVVDKVSDFNGKTMLEQQRSTRAPISDCSQCSFCDGSYEENYVNQQRRMSSFSVDQKTCRSIPVSCLEFE